MNLVEILEKTALDRGTYPAFIDKREVLDYSTFLDELEKQLQF